MSEVRCWCCEYYILIDNPYVLHFDNLYGICKRKRELCYMHNKICDFFVLRQGLHTNKAIPKF